MNIFLKRTKLAIYCHQFLLLFFVVFGAHQAQAFNQCVKLFSHITAETYLQRLQEANATVRASSLEAPSPREVTAFLRESFPILKSFQKIGTDTIPFHLWLAIEPLLFSSRIMRTEENSLEIQIEYQAYLDRIFGDRFWYHVDQAKRNRTSATYVLRAIQKANLFYSTILGKEIDLATKAGLFDLFGVDKKAQLAERRKELIAANRELNGEIGEFLARSSTDARSLRSRIVRRYFGEDVVDLDLRTRDVSYFSRNASAFETVVMIHALKLPEARRDYYLDEIEAIASGRFYTPRARQLNAVVVLTAYREAKNSLQAGDPKAVRELYIVAKTELAKEVAERLRQDELLVNFMHEQERLNKRLLLLEDAISKRKSEVVDDAELTERLDRIQTVAPQRQVETQKDDLTLFEQSLRKAERQLIAYTRERKEIGQYERIEGIAEISNWAEVLANHKYRVNKADERPVNFDYIEFSPTVMVAFERSPEVAKRYLGYLQRGAYARSGDSGIRAMSAIHPQFVVINIQSGGGVPRLMGKIIGDTLYFFDTHTSQRDYNPSRTRQRVENFSIEEQ